ncbi:ribonuclease 3-like [Planoprotostelium fungivorum]|uniref:Ribonuclease 3-like n=1 Tax=Planoprotostelium fungivorum TaxID=1890364 RepID=A0A2P6NI36_9EUKA|nr:ribonuclease 3-like [Planoprotostelium fungivorum]
MIDDVYTHVHVTKVYWIKIRREQNAASTWREIRSRDDSPLYHLSGFLMLTRLEVTVPDGKVLMDGDTARVSGQFLYEKSVSVEDWITLLEYQKFLLCDLTQQSTLMEPLSRSGTIFLPAYVTDMSLSSIDFNLNISLVDRMKQRYPVIDLIHQTDLIKDETLRMKQLKSMLLGRVIRSDYNDRYNCIKKIFSNIKPTSEFIVRVKKQKVVTNYIHYYKDKYGVDIFHHEQPLLHCGAGPPSDNADSTSGNLLVPELCSVLEMNCGVQTMFQTLHHVWNILQVSLQAGRLEENVLHFKMRQQKTLQEAITLPGSLLFDSNYQRLEFVGDSFLKFMVSERMYRLHPEHDEGKLTESVKSFIRNSFLQKLARATDIHHILDIQHDSAGSDVLEAILGAVLIDHGINQAKSLFEKFVTTYLQRDEGEVTLRGLWNGNSKESTQKQRRDHLMNNCIVDEKFFPLMRDIGVSLKDGRTLDMAFTGGTEHNYERLEFLGDSILGMFVSIYLYEKFPKASEGPLTQTKANLVSNYNLSFCSKNLKLDQLLSTKDGTVIRGLSEKTTANVFESLIAVLYLELGADAAKSFILHYNVSFSEENLHQLQTDWKSGILHIYSHQRIEYKVLGRERMGGDINFHVGLFIDGQMKAEAKATSIRRAEMLASSEVLNHDKKKLPFYMSLYNAPESANE